MKVTKRNGRIQELSIDKISFRLKKIAKEQNLSIDTDVITIETVNSLIDNISVKDIDVITARISISHSINNPEYGKLAAGIVVSNLHKNTTSYFSECVKECALLGLVSEELSIVVEENKEILNNTIKNERDYLFDYFGFKTLERSYLIKKESGDILERPQYMWMRVALGIHGKDTAAGIETYNLMSQLYFTHASPTLFNAGTKRPAMSSCFLLECPDSMAGIYKCLSDCALISKNSGGIGIHISGVRSKGSVIKGTNGKSDGIVKMLKVFNETARFANQGSKRNGSFAIYLPCYHADIFDFLELRKNTGEETLRARDLFYALWVSDFFMECVKNDGDWYLMSEDRSSGLSDVYGEEFKKLYLSYVRDGIYVEKIKARDLWQKILVSQIETGMPYITYKDHCNNKSNQKNAGVIKSSNLCVAPETKILTENGYHKIKDLLNKKVKVWNGEEFSETTVYKTGENQELIKVLLSDGSEMDCTPYHKFYVKEGEKNIKIEARFLVPGMKLVTFRFPVIRTGYDYLVLPYELGLKCKENSIQDSVPINCNIEMKLRWLEGFVDSNGEIENNELVVYWEGKNIKDVKYMLNTLGCHPEITTISIAKNLLRMSVSSSDVNLLKNLGFSPRVLKLQLVTEEYPKVREVRVKEIHYNSRISDTYCFTEEKRNMGIFNGVLTGNCNEITLISNTEETAVCNICTFSLPKFLDGNFFNHKKLYDVVYVAARNMNKVIDRNYYPTPEAKKSNFKLRPVAMGIQGLANLFFELRIPFESDQARQLNREIMETIQYAAWKSSNDLSKEKCETYDRFEGSPISQGLFQHDMWRVSPGNRWDWDELRESIKKYGAMNSMMTSLPPTASTSQILGNYESFEPQNSNIFMRSTLSGDFPIVNKYLINDLVKLGLWNENVKNEILSNKGSVQNIVDIPQDIRNVYKTIWEIPQKVLLEMSRDRGYFVDQSQSLNVYMENANIAKLSSMHFYGWSLGLKTGMYYLRTRAATSAQQFTVSPKKDLIACSIDNRDACEACSG